MGLRQRKCTGRIEAVNERLFKEYLYRGAAKKEWGGILGMSVRGKGSLDEQWEKQEHWCEWSFEEEHQSLISNACFKRQASVAEGESPHVKFPLLIHAAFGRREHDAHLCSPLIEIVSGIAVEVQ